MSTTVKVLIGIGIVAALVLVIYFATRPTTVIGADGFPVEANGSTRTGWGGIGASIGNTIDQFRGMAS